MWLRVDIVELDRTIGGQVNGAGPVWRVGALTVEESKHCSIAGCCLGSFTGQVQAYSLG